jgi:cytochrome c1
MDRRHIAATEHLTKARQFAKDKAKDREDRLPPLTDEQREQLHEYLRLLAEREPEVYPNVNNMRRRD